jgi:hypothetical protein
MQQQEVARFESDRISRIWIYYNYLFKQVTCETRSDCNLPAQIYD